MWTQRVRSGRDQFRALGFRGGVQFKLQNLLGKLGAHRGPYRLHSKHAAAPIWCRPGTSDLAVFRQVFIQREYRCLDDVEDVKFVIDCGANVGYSAAYLLSRFPTARVVAVEPEPGNFEMLRRNTVSFGDRVQLIRAGVWSHPTGLVIESPAGDNAAWAFRVREARTGEPPDVVATDLTTIWRQAGSPEICILKMDIEGSEAQVFAAADKPWLEAARNMVVEVHGEACDATLKSSTQGLGFDVSHCEELTVLKRPN